MFGFFALSGICFTSVQLKQITKNNLLIFSGEGSGAFKIYKPSEITAQTASPRSDVHGGTCAMHYKHALLRAHPGMSWVHCLCSELLNTQQTLCF